MPTTAHSRAHLDLTKIDWAKIDATSDEEIDAQIAADADTAPSFTVDEILAAGRRIEPDDVVDVQILRNRLGLSQAAFAARYGFSVDAIRQYERKRRIPSGAIRTLLTVIAHEPDAVTRALAHRKSRDEMPLNSGEIGR
jgi:putative transcriptional regulator